MDQQEPAYPPAVATRETSGMAIASLILAICGIWPVGLILGIIARNKIKQSSGRLGGMGLATAGIIVSSVMLAVALLFSMVIPVVFYAYLANYREYESPPSSVRYDAPSAPASMQHGDSAEVVSTKATLTTLLRAVNMFKLDTGYYPSEEAGLIELIEQPTDLDGWMQGGYLEDTTLLNDGWGNPFVYILNPESGKPFVIISYGADGMEGGDGYDADIYITDRH